MRLVSFRSNGSIRTGVVIGEEVVDLCHPSVGLPADMVALLRAGADGLAAAGRAPAGPAPRTPLAEVELVAPVPVPPSFLAIARNYADHSRELGVEPPGVQTWFAKQPTCVVGPGAPIEVPRVSDMVDYEGELGMVIGRRGRHVPASAALDLVAGFIVVNDVSVRDWQLASPTMMMGKGFDTHGPTGPWIVTPDEVEDPRDLTVRTWVNGELRQDGSTADMIFDCAQMIEHLSAAFTLVPGMLLSTGTPAGVGLASTPPRWLRAGDVVRIEVGGVGTIENPVVDEGDAGR